MQHRAGIRLLLLTRGQLWQNWMFGRMSSRKNWSTPIGLSTRELALALGVALFSMPYFRLYNPCPDAKSSLNAETKSAQFIKFVPELKHFPPKLFMNPTSPHPFKSIEAYGKDSVHRGQKTAKENLIRLKRVLLVKVLLNHA